MAQDGTCFYLSTEEVHWETAKRRCEQIVGHLVMIKTAEQQQKVVDFLRRKTQKLNYSIHSICMIYMMNDI